MKGELTTVVATHEGRHHADEVLACWFISVLLEGSLRIVRTSDRWLQDSADILLDCGGSYDAVRERFDHHGVDYLPEVPAARLSGYATAGLVWQRYGPLICRTLLEDCNDGNWKRYTAGASDEKVAAGYHTLARIMDQEIVSPIDNWDLGFYPCRQLAKQMIPFQWLLPHLEFDVAVQAMGRAFYHRLRTLADNIAGETSLETDLLENGPCEFWIFGPWLVVKAGDGKRVELRAARNFAYKVMQLPLLAVVSSLRGGTRWGAFTTATLPETICIPKDLEFAAGRRSFFHDDADRLMDFLRECAERNELPAPFIRVESSHEQSS